MFIGIVQAIKLEGEDIRLTNGNRWLYWNSNVRQWVVREIPQGKAVSNVLFEGRDEGLAVEVLLKGALSR